MAFKCQIDWDSWINPRKTPPPRPPTDGKFVILTMTGAKFTGQHQDNRGNRLHDMEGTCQDRPHHRIRINCREHLPSGPIIHSYDGQILDDEAVERLAVGIRKGGGGRGLDNGDDVWVGVKST